MSPGETIILMGVGGGFILLGIIMLLWGRYEEKRLFDALAEKRDLREFSLKHVDSPQPGALRIGGWIGIALGVLLLLVGVVLRLTI